MINENITIHDKFKFEIKFNYPIKEKKTKYEIESYLFFPQSLAISEYFDNQSFYHSIQSYIRFKTPTILLKDIPEKSSILKKSFEKLAKEFNKKNKKEFENSIKLYGVISKSSLREHFNFIKTKKIKKDLEFLIEEYIKHSQRLLNSYRDLRKTIIIPTIKENIFSIFRYGDEYLSIVVNKTTYRILEEIKDKNIDKKYIDKLLTQIENELNYRKINNLNIQIYENSDNSLFLYKSSNLKKFISSLLFLNTRTDKADRFITQMVYSFAAGLSMIFATFVAFKAQHFFGSFTTPLFMALVVSYIFKDRIKDLIKFYFNKKFRKKVFDYKTVIKHNSKIIGVASERATITSFEYLDEEIKKIRVPQDFTIINNGINGEDVIFYKKKIKIFSSAVDEKLHGIKIDGINDIIRFDISKYTRNMDNPTKKIFFYKDRNYTVIKAKKVYHINLVMIYTDGKKDKVYKKFRIILNRRGIINIRTE